MRVKDSIGQCFVNKGTITTLKEEKYVIDKTRQFYLFDVIPMGGVRMSSSDRWKTNPNHPDPAKRQRPIVTKYWAAKDLMKVQAAKMGFVLGNFLDAVFFVPMPESWSEKKKNKMNGMPCKKRPDWDNYSKAVCDFLRDEDGDIWLGKVEKRYAWKGSILIYG